MYKVHHGSSPNKPHIIIHDSIIFDTHFFKQSSSFIKFNIPHLLGAFNSLKVRYLASECEQTGHDLLITIDSYVPNMHATIKCPTAALASWNQANGPQMFSAAKAWKQEFVMLEWGTRWDNEFQTISKSQNL